jgi:DNA primase
VLDGARDFIDHMLDFATSTRNLAEPREKSRLAGELVEMIRLLDNSIARDAAIQKVAMRIGIPEAEYRREVMRALKAAAAPGSRQAAAPNAAAPTLGPQDKNAMMLCRLALAEVEILNWLRQTNRQEILRDISGTQLLSVVWSAESDLSDPMKFGSFCSTLSREEEAGLNLLMTRPLPSGGLAAAQHALLNLEMQRVKNLQFHIGTQLKQPGLQPEQIMQLQTRVIALRKEYLDLEARSQDIPPLPET